MPNIVDNLQAAFASRGAVGPAVSQQRPGLATPKQAQQPMDPNSIQMQVKDTLMRNPQVQQQIQMTVQQAMASGQLTPQELNTAVQLARVALNDPSTYPRLRLFAIQNGIATEQDLPEQMDQGMLVALITVAEAMQAGAQQGGAAQQPAQQQGSGGYTIPANVVQMKGQEFFDNLVKKYNPSGE